MFGEKMARRENLHTNDTHLGSSSSMNPEAYMKRVLHYRERHSGWHIFQSIYWGIYLFVLGMIIILQPTLGYTLQFGMGFAILILSLMIVIYGFVTALHIKLMKKYG